MFIPASPSLIVSRSKLPPVDESVWYPVEQTEFVANSEPTLVGINLGVLVTVQIVGTITAILYWRVSDTMPTSGTAALWQLSDFTDVLLSEVDFTGHSGTGWKTITLPEPIKVNAAHGYIAHVWFPSGGSSVVTPVFAYQFAQGHGFFSEPYGIVYAMIAAGNNDYRGFVKNNGWIQAGAFARPTTGYEGHGFGVDVIVHGSPLPIPPDPPMILKWPIPAGWPDATTTGPDPDTVFGDPELEPRTSLEEDEIIEDRIFHAGLIVSHNGVTVRNCIIKNHYPNALFISQGVTNVLVEDCIMDCYGKVNGGSTGIGCGGTDIIIRRCNIYRSQDGITIFGKPYPVNALIEDCFIHNLRAAGGSVGGLPHYDCVQFDGGQTTVVVRHNTIMLEHNDTGTVQLNNEGGKITDFLIEDNVMYGGGFTVYLDEQKDYPGEYPITNIRFLRNLWQPGFWGYHNISSVEVPIMRGNVLMDNGSIYDYPPPEGFAVGDVIAENLFGYKADISANIIGESIDEETGGVTLGVGFRVTQDGQITGVSFARSGSSTTGTLKIGVWRFTGSTKDSGTELLASKTYEGLNRYGNLFFALDTPVDVDAGDDLVVGVFIPRGSDGKLWYYSKAGWFWPNPRTSQWGRMTAYSNNSANQPPGFTGGNGLYHYGPDLTAPTSTTAFDASYQVDVVFEGVWPEGIVPVYGSASYVYGSVWPVVRVGTNLIFALTSNVTVNP